MDILAAKPERKTAAWPAELPPPTSAISSRRHIPRFDGGSPIPDATALELLKAGNIGAPVARSGRDHHRLGLDAPAIGQAQGKGGNAAIEPGDFHGNGHLGAEFLRLYEGAAGQRLPRDAGRKSEIVLDAGARACLSAEGAGIEHDHGQTFRGGIDSGRKTGESGADDRNVVGSIRGVVAHHAEAAREVRCARILEHGPVGEGSGA
jgi:hypothetical protein